MVEERLMWCKYRPTKLKNVILLPRIRDAVSRLGSDEAHMPGNLLLCGPSGLGKTTLAEILTSNHDTLKVNASKDSSVDDLRETVSDFCRGYNILSDSDDAMKVVYLDEFDGVSSKYQEAMRGFIEDNEKRVRFLATCNDPSKVTSHLQSRFMVIDFAPRTADEVQYLMDMYHNRLSAIVQKEGIDVDDVELGHIISSNFPDMRSMMNKLQLRKYTKADNASSSTNDVLYGIVTSPADPRFVFEEIMSNWAAKVPLMVGALGRPFAEWVLARRPDLAKFLPDIMPLVVKYNERLKEAIDPVVLGCALVYEIQKTVNQ